MKKVKVVISKLIILVFVFLLPHVAVGHKSNLINPELMNSKWDAHWISFPNVSLTDFGIYHFRKTFNLEQIANEFVIHVSGDNRYRLFVNGKEVCNGPARGDLANWNFETIDIAPYLKSGENVLAAVVWNFAEFKPLAQMSNKTAFILQGNSKLEQIVNTDKTWKTLKNEAYQSPSKKPPRTVVGPGEIVDGSKYPYGWNKIDFDDNQWFDSRMLGKGVPDGQFTSWDWNLVPRSIPFMEFEFQRICEVERTENIEVEKNFLNGVAPLIIPSNTNAKILLDQTYLTTAYPELNISGGKGASVELLYGEAMVDKNGVKGNRNQTLDKDILSYYSDVFYPDGASNRKYQPLWFRTYRYLELIITTADDPLIINDIYGFFTAYPFKEKAFFNSNDQSLEDIWNVGWRTARLCAGETYYDAPYYEQLQYVGDTRIQALISLYVAGDDKLMRNAIEQFNNSLLPIGLTQSRFPSSEPQVIPPFSLIWIYMIHDFWIHRDDTSFVNKHLNGIRNVLHWYEDQIDDNGMLGSMDWWNFVDWSFGPFSGEVPIGGTPSGARDGNSSIITLQYVKALQKATELFRYFGNNALADHYLQLSNSLVKNTLSLCWSSERNLLADSPKKDEFSEHANILAILTDMVDEKESTSLFDRLLSEKDLVKATYYFKFYFMRAMKKSGKANQYLDLLEPWRDMIDLGLTTFAEKPEPTRSDCHAWSAHPNYDLLATVCGITPSSPGFKTVKIEPYMGDLEFIECLIPHPKGNILLNLKKKNKNGLTGDITLPDGLKGEFLWGGKKIMLNSGKQSISL